MKQSITPLPLRINWRHLLMILLVAGSLALLLAQRPLGQDPEYHNFADRRELFGIPNFLNVASNLPFLMVGLAGLKFCLERYPGEMKKAWIILFAGVSLVSVGSAYYHLNPNNQTLLWDRLPMTIGFMGLFAALLGEYISERLGLFLLVPLVLLGFSSVVYWYFSDDLRFYIWVQFIPLLSIPLLMILFRSKHSRQWMLLAALGWYALAKLSEVFDAKVFTLSAGFVSGHTIKHLLSALGCWMILLMLRQRKFA